MLGDASSSTRVLATSETHSEAPNISQPTGPSVPPQPSKPPSHSQQLEDELELDLENMKIDENIDTSVRL